MIKTGLFFGSFNPIHIGHLIIASYIHQFTDLEEVWIVVSPKNPLKPELELLEEEERLKMAQLAVEHNPSLKVCDIEFYLHCNFFCQIGEKCYDIIGALVG